MSRLRVLVVSPYYVPAWRAGGPVRSLAAMVAQHGDRHEFTVLTSAYDWEQASPMEVPATGWVPAGRARVRYLPVRSAGSLLRPAAARAWWRAWREALASRPDVAYLTGVFPPVWSVLPLVARRLGLLRMPPVVIAPRGEFGAGALALKGGRKRAFLRLARAAGLFTGVAWHASSPAEATEIAAVLPGARIVVRENETELPARAVRGCGDSPAAGEARPLRIAYLGRVSPKKGVDVLLRALPQVSAPVQVSVHGAADPGYLARCEALAAQAGHPVEFTGQIRPERVAAGFAAADVFVFPTASENFGHTIAEALAAGCPVLLTRSVTPWDGPVAAGGGALVEGRDPAAWAAAIDDFAAGGPAGWATARERAAGAYDAWRARCPADSVFDRLGFVPG